MRSVITEGTQEAAQSVISQIPTRERIDFAQVRHEALIGAIVGGGTGALMQRASRAIEDIPELSPEAQQVYNEAEQTALDGGATLEESDIAGTKALGATEEGQEYIEATADAMDAVFRAEAAMGRLEEPGAILPTTELTEEEFNTLFESGATEEEIVAKLIADVEEAETPAEGREVPEIKFKSTEDLSQIGDIQRGAPESAMLKLTHNPLAAGRFLRLPEWAGDLVHRMTKGFEHGKKSGVSEGLGAALPKVKDLLGWLKNPDFKKTLESNRKGNIKALTEEGRDITTIETKFKEALSSFVEEHRKIPIPEGNRPLKLANDAAIAIGEQRWNDAVKTLEELESIMENRELYAKEIVKGIKPTIVDTTAADAALTGLQTARQEETTAQIRERAEKIEADAISSLTALESEQDPLPHLEALGNLVFNEGATDIKTFSKRMQEKLGDLWEQFKEFMQTVFDKLKSERGSFEFGRDVPLFPELQLDENLKPVFDTDNRLVSLKALIEAGGRQIQSIKELKDIPKQDIIKVINKIQNNQALNNEAEKTTALAIAESLGNAFFAQVGQSKGDFLDATEGLAEGELLRITDQGIADFINNIKFKEVKKPTKAQIQATQVKEQGETIKNLEQEVVRLKGIAQRQSIQAFRQEERLEETTDILVAEIKEQVRLVRKARSEGRQEAVARARQQINEIRGRIGREKTKVRIERETRRTVTQFVKDVIPLSEQGKFLKAIANARTPKQFGEVIERAQKFAEEFTEQDLKKRLRAKIKRELKTTKVKKKGGKPVGKFTPEVQNTLDLLRDAAKLSTEEAEAKVVANLEKYPDTIPPDNVALENRVLSMVHGFDNRTSAELETLLQEIKDIKNEGSMISELRKFNRQANIERVVGESIDVVTGGKGIPASISAGKQAAGIDISDRQSVFEKAAQWLGTKDLWLQGWPDLFNKLSRLDPSISKPGELTNPLEEFADVTKEEEVEKKGLRLNIIKIRNLFKKAYGIKVDTSRKSEREMFKKMREDTKVIDLGVYENSDGKKIHLKFTRAQARKRFMELQDPTLVDTFTEGMRYTEDMLIAITETLTAQDKDFAKSELEFYREYYKGVNNVYRDIYGVDLPFNEFYNPIRRELVKGQDDIMQTGGFGEFLQDLNTRGSVTSKSFISRVKNINPILQQSDVAVLEQHLAEMEKFKAWAKKIRDFNAVFGDVEFKTAVELYHGKGFLSTINNFVADYIRGGVDESGRLHWVDKVRGNIARSVLALKPIITTKQLISTIAYAESIPVAEFAKGELDFWKNPVKNSKFMYKHSELLKSRGQNQERDLKTALKSDEFSAYRARPNFLNSLMLNIQLGDQGAIVVGGHAVIKYHMDQGKSIEEAFAIFGRLTSSTQQSADKSLLSTTQRGGSFAKMFTQFMSAPNLYYRREMWALRNLMHGKIDKKQFTKTIMLYHVLIPMIFQFISDGFTWDEDEQFRAFLLGPWNGVFIAGDIVNGIIRRALGLRRYDDEVPIMTIVDDAARGWDLWDWNNLTSEEFHNALRGLAGAVGKWKGVPLKTALDMGQGIDEVLTGKFEEGAIQTLGYSPTVVKKRTGKKGGTF